MEMHWLGASRLKFPITSSFMERQFSIRIRAVNAQLKGFVSKHLLPGLRKSEIGGEHSS